MADETTSYGTKFQKEGSTPDTYVDIADVVSIKPPSIETEAIESTNHGNNGKKTYIPSGLIGLSEFSITVNYKSTDSLAAEVGQMGNYKIVFPNGLSWKFQAVMLSFSVNEADATSPDVLQAEISFQPSGECAIETES